MKKGFSACVRGRRYPKGLLRGEDCKRKIRPVNYIQYHHGRLTNRSHRLVQRAVPT
jgi:hypothetical protein